MTHELAFEHDGPEGWTVACACGHEVTRLRPEDARRDIAGHVAIQEARAKLKETRA